ncbi:MAG TPA: toll/interleukin-1 receptor domain-containing protein [Burkholderiaceae bacterium]|nr:toll/interleukin-1 receptor domain-containing protein [Burkholderiaceae bacterium]
MKLFISHASEESAIALILQDWIESTFLGKVDVFVSTNSKDSPVGDQWFNSLQAALESATTSIIICSRTSHSRPWMNFEAGACWIKGIPIIPLTIGGLINMAIKYRINYNS